VTLLSGIVAVMNRLLGDVATATVGWAIALLYGRVPRAKQSTLSLVALGSLVWIIALLAVIIPTLGGMLISSVPRPGFVPVDWLRLALVIVAIGLPPIIGLSMRIAFAPDGRPSLAASLGEMVRGYPLTAVLAGAILFLAVAGLMRQVRAARHRLEDEHIPLIVKPGRYGAVSNDIAAALEEAGLAVARVKAPRSAEIPIRLVAAVSGRPHDEAAEELCAFRGDGVDIVLYPSEALILGEPAAASRAKAAIARRLTFSDVYLTTGETSEEIEDRLREIAHRRNVTAADFRSIDDSLTRLPMPYDDWATIYRLRLQVEHEARLPGSTGQAHGS